MLPPEQGLKTGHPVGAQIDEGADSAAPARHSS
jgi:hypothetical protein